MLLDSVIKEYSERNVNSGKLNPPHHESYYWELRIHETIPDKYWQITRRLVITSCARAENPKCTSFCKLKSTLSLNQLTYAY